mmetsp:Transcript_31700/g.43493  ORF Transcript_31700/g.43493 Transcript_31700/m.43493 type:complete len:491 (-) Transcript_31700:58-1530(-)|eukprot:CAMPEP_0201501432 /NCGR_PEP_ID=MMETSP0151_2-20130828/83587_1 /ASSEMBLY_ACC=CAM_ASM_000257 /TAXON_ID=200890 /ORGANISM="Paramoeba atlantica, Strain 621/1 / CCAP 1560/9" /LENGTH=490 /DNA_ID=CAMNT_0047894939 /DNA_START=111 /DNA_END=1583 /DNA_ORIENTATION=+
MAEASDPLVQDGKRLPNSSSLRVFPTFLFFCIVVLPITLFVLLPLTIICALLKPIVRLVKPKQPRKKPPPPLPKSELSVPDPSQRKYDLVLLGATGFTGNLSAHYLAKQYGSSIRWAIAGRRKEVLEKLQQKLASEVGSSDPICDVLLLNTLDEESLRKTLPLSRAIISTVGPFARYGSLVVKVCAETGTNYADITGETDWVRSMVDTYSTTAEATGARIVHFCGHDCVPWDILVHSLASFYSDRKEQLKEVHCYDEIRSSPSGGTLETVFDALENRTRQKPDCGFDPLLLISNEGKIEKSPHKFRADNKSFLGYSKEFKHWTGPFVMASVMANCVKRSNAVLGYGPNVKYSEAVVYPNFFAGFVNVATMFVFGLSLFNPLLQYLLQKYVLPAPGQGPSTETMDRGFLRVTAFGSGTNGTKAVASLYFPTDPGYRDTARMLVESGLCLSVESDRLQGPGGVMTPAIGLGPLLLERLQKTGCTYSAPKELN